MFALFRLFAFKFWRCTAYIVGPLMFYMNNAKPDEEYRTDDYAENILLRFSI